MLRAKGAGEDQPQLSEATAPAGTQTPRPPPPLAVGAEVVTGRELEKAGTAIRVYCRWQDVRYDRFEEWVPLLAVKVDGALQQSVVRGLWASRRFGGEPALTRIVATAVSRRVEKRGWKQFVYSAAQGSRSLGF